MGAYFNCTLNHKRYDTYSMDNGAKLMEHSYLGNEYVNVMMGAILNNPKEVVWLCDYHEADDMTSHTWDNTKGIDKYPKKPRVDLDYFILNHTKKLVISVSHLQDLYNDDDKSSWHIHPIPILCNSDDGSLGGGDYHAEDSRRATWCGDTLEVQLVRDGFDDYKKITKDCLFYERD